MITCNRCGFANRADEKNCRMCGAPLTSNNENGLSPKMGAPEQPELPAWLESLRSNERPVASSGGSAEQFNAANLIDEGTLPAWMRSDSLGGGQPMPAQGYAQPQPSASGSWKMPNTLRSSSTPAPNTDENAFNTPAISANSLIDEQALPSWMRQQDESSTGQAGRNVSASSLIQQDALPEWLRAASAQQPTQAMPPQQRPMQAMEQQPPQTPPTGMHSASPSQPFLPPQNFSARDLIDPQALPSWMAQNSQPDMSPSSPASQPPLGAGQAGFSASSLLDMNALPAWMRESEQKAGTSGSQTGFAAQSSSWQGAPTQPPSAPSQGRTGQSGASWQQPQASWQQPQQPQASWQQPQQPQASWQQPQQPQAPSAAAPNSGTFSASSFIDVNALPEWLRSAAEPGMQGQQPTGGAMQPRSGAPRQGTAVPPRVENVRVPSRPRSEMGSNEGSEAAAHVFASMLGVASAAPQFPAAHQGPGPSGVQNQQSSGQPMSMYGNTMPPMPANGPTGIPGMQGAGPMQQAANAPMQQGPSYYGQGGYGAGQNSMGMGMGMGTPGMPAQAGPGPQQGAMPPAPYTSMGVASMSGNGMMANGQNSDAKPAKRGLFEAIRSWLAR